MHLQRESNVRGRLVQEQQFFRGEKIGFTSIQIERADRLVVDLQRKSRRGAETVT